MMNWKNSLICCCLALATLPSYAQDAGKSLEMKFVVQEGSGDAPMIVLWVENDSGEFIKTLSMFSKRKKYYDDLLAWKFKSKKEPAADIDAVSGATIKWSQTRTITIPARLGDRNLLDGTYILRIESRKDKGGHYRSFQIPLPADYKGGIHKDDGYVKQVEITIKDAK